MQKLLILVALVVLTGCSLLGQSDYSSHTLARVEFKQSDDARLAAQSQAIADMAARQSGSQEAAAYKAALGMLAIAMLKNQDYSEAPPVTWSQVGGKVVDAVPFIAGMGGAYLIAKEGIRAAGNVSIGENSTVSGSFNQPVATNLGDGAATVQPYDVRPEVVQPVIVEPTIVPGG